MSTRSLNRNDWDWGDLHGHALQLAALLQGLDVKLVLAESCTGGMVAAALAGIPGISRYLCGSSVVYREQTKQQWLGITARELKKFDPVSDQIAVEMAAQALLRTDEADVAAAITGHLGPDAPSRKNGQLYIAVALRGMERVLVQEFRLPTQSAKPKPLEQLHVDRIERQMSASHAVLFMVRSLLEALEPAAEAETEALSGVSSRTSRATPKGARMGRNKSKSVLKTGAKKSRNKKK